jgi:cardiolipin synthase
LAARLTKQYTKLGLYLDPIADKLLLSTLFVVLTHMNLVPRYVTVLVFSRDLGILLVATLLFATGTLRDFRPSLLGKFNTLVQILGLTMVLIEQVWPSVDGRLLRVGLLRSIAWLAPISAAQYAWIVVQRVSTPEPQAAKQAAEMR